MNGFAELLPLHLLQNPLIEHIGWALLHSLWQIAGLTAILAIALRFLRHRSAALRYYAGCAVLSLMCVAPLVTFLTMPMPSTLASKQPLQQDHSQSRQLQQPASAHVPGDRKSRLAGKSVVGPAAAAPPHSAHTQNHTYIS